MFELSIKVSDDEQKLTQDHLIYDENVTLSHDDPVLKQKVNLAIDSFKGSAQDIVLRIKMVW